MKDGKVIRDYIPGYAGYLGLQHNVVIEHFATEHPILKGLPTRWKHVKDEIYTKLRGPLRKTNARTGWTSKRHSELRNKRQSLAGRSNIQDAGIARLLLLTEPAHWNTTA